MLRLTLRMRIERPVPLRPAPSIRHQSIPASLSFFVTLSLSPPSVPLFSVFSAPFDASFLAAAAAVVMQNRRSSMAPVHPHHPHPHRRRLHHQSSYASSKLAAVVAVVVVLFSVVDTGDERVSDVVR